MPARGTHTPAEFKTASGIPVSASYGPDGQSHRDVPAGQFPYTRGIHANMYRGRLWSMRQFAGFGTAEGTNQRFRYLLEQGQTGLSVAFDLPTLMGLDADNPASEGEVGKCGVAISSVEDMEVLFQGIPLDQVSVSMTINSPAAVIWAMYIVAAERQGVNPEKLSGTLQNDILKEYIAQKEYIYPPRPSMRLVTDTIEYSARHLPKFNPISISGYHIREAGSTAVQELAFTLADGIEYANWAIERGLKIDEFAPRLSFFFNSQSDFFEEIAKFRAARRMWANLMRDRFHAQDERSWKLRFHAQTAGSSLTWQQPKNNVARTALQAMAAVLGGAQSLHTNSLDEAYALPSEQAATLALRTQQVIAHESGVTAEPDPFGGSWYLEQLTDEVERQAYEYIRQLDEMGGMIPAIERGFPQSEIAGSSYEFQREIESGAQKIVGVNAFTEEGAHAPDLLQMDEGPMRRQRVALDALRSKRSSAQTDSALNDLRQKAAGSENTMPYILGAVRAGATLGEICEALRQVFGTYQESSFI